MKAYLSFRLPEEKEEFELAQRAGAAEIIIEDILNYLRTAQKYEDKKVVSINDLRTFIVQECIERGVPV